MTPTEQLLTDFYTAFQARDYARMNACYAPGAHFEDPIFSLDGTAIHAMWHMLCEAGENLQLTFRGIEADASEGRAHWEPVYPFGASGRTVHNVIDARFRFENGLIAEHRDSFDLWRWSRQALGLPGVLLGWTPMLQSKVRQTARGRLDRFIAKHPEYA